MIWIVLILMLLPLVLIMIDDEKARVRAQGLEPKKETKPQNNYLSKRHNR